MSTIEKLLAVQDIDIRIREIEQEMHDIPARQEQEQTRLNEHKQALEKAEEDLKLAQANVHKLELESESRHEKIGKLRQQQMELKTNKEFKAMEHEIAAIKEKISGLEDEELVLMEQVELAKGDVKARSEALDEEASAVAADVAVLDERMGSLEGEIGDYRVRRDEAVVGLDNEWISYYDKVWARRKDGALVKLVGGVCGGCHMKLPPAVQNATKRKDEMVRCEWCGRLLYS